MREKKKAFVDFSSVQLKLELWRNEIIYKNKTLNYFSGLSTVLHRPTRALNLKIKDFFWFAGNLRT